MYQCDEEQRTKILKILKALADETRLEIFSMLRGGELCACRILEKLKVTQPTLSHHMKVLCDCGLVVARKDWKWTHYSLDCEVLKEFAGYISACGCMLKK